MVSASKTVRELANVVGGTLVAGDSHTPIADVTHDSRQAGPGTLFVAIRGANTDGHAFVPEAVEAGSPAVCVEHPTGAGVAEIVVVSSRSALGPLSAAAHGEPSQALKVIGVTGTNGKTTVTHYISSIVSSTGLVTGLIGTIQTRIGSETTDSVHTTPEASDFQRLLALMRDRGAGIVAAEISSHALALERVAATRFAVAAFTNLSRDHLDFHGDMDSYLAAKRSLFEDYEIGTAVINVDDAAGSSIARSVSTPLVTVGTSGEVRHENPRPSAEGTSFTLITPWGSAPVKTPVVGSFNLDNALLAAASCLAADVGFEDVVSGLEGLEGVPGRFEVVSGRDPIRVIVDYAHTPSGITEAIKAARSLGGGRVITVIGAGGDRDRTKRPLMGASVSAADLAVITSDNPRSEDPSTIITALVEGLDPVTESIIEIDRHLAIRRAVGEARDGDIVLVLGRGHEPTQEVAGERRPFDDRVVAREALRAHRMSADSQADSGSMEE